MNNDREKLREAIAPLCAKAFNAVSCKSHDKILNEIIDLIEQRNEWDDKAKDIATEFFYHWFNSAGTNTSQGFDDWWKLNKQRFFSQSSKND